ncbi:DUF6035 family protein [Photobacterium alginatilyticum]|uniref:Competence protein CoiA-like family protein n=1 Tax=Photobacterium alginatilyticum TaxID=1775171 RepID=A0ABW9YP26_9GAMM|nr:hypothetical protein [Photobacterium alginatilyticum]
MITQAISQIFIPDTDETVNTSTYLDKPEEELFEIRRKLRPKVKELTLLCPTCFQPLILAGKKGGGFYFRHVKDSDDCPIKTTCNLTQEQMLAIQYNGQKEGRTHRDNKHELANLLSMDSAFEDINVEKTFREENPTGIAKSWRRPDVAATYIAANQKVAFELQVSTTFIDVIISREQFYKENNAYIAWVFLNFEARTFSELDIAYANRGNALVFDKDAIEASKQANELILKCFYKKPEIIEDSDTVYINDYWEHVMVPVRELQFDKAEGKLYFVDSKQLKKDAESFVMKRRAEIRQQKEAEAEALRQQQLKEKELRVQARASLSFIVKENPPIHSKPKTPSERRKRLKETLSTRIFNTLEKSKSLDSLCCPKCNNNDSFYYKACFVYCQVCRSEVKY